MKKKGLFLSCIVPVFNEADRVENIRQVSDFFAQQPFGSEIIAVNDGSTDGTLKKLRELQNDFPIEIVSYRKNRGKGYAVKKGMLKAKGQFRLFVDVDLSTPLKEFERFKPQIRKHDVVIASRKSKGAKLIARQPKLRETLGKGFTLLSQTLLGVYVSDFTCGFKCFSAKAAERIFPRLLIERWGFDSEILYLCKKYGLEIREVPVAWKNDYRTKVRFPQDMIRSLSDLVRIRINDLKGRYSI